MHSVDVFPLSKNELVKFGFKVESDFVCPNLSSSLTKEKNLRTVLMSVLKKKIRSQKKVAMSCHAK